MSGFGICYHLVNDTGTKTVSLMVGWGHRYVLLFIAIVHRDPFGIMLSSKFCNANHHNCFPRSLLNCIAWRDHRTPETCSTPYFHANSTFSHVCSLPSHYETLRYNTSNVFLHLRLTIRNHPMSLWLHTWSSSIMQRWTRLSYSKYGFMLQQNQETISRMDRLFTKEIPFLLKNKDWSAQSVYARA